MKPRKVPLRPVVPKKIRPVPPRKVEPPRRVLPMRKVPLKRPEAPCPWGDEDLARIVEEACRFIAGVKERVGADLAREVGDYLFFTVYRGDEIYVRKNDRSKQDSLRDISKGCDVPFNTLRNWLYTAIVRHKLGRAGLRPDLSDRHLRALYTLADDLDAMVELVEWAEGKGASARELSARVQQLLHRKVTVPRRRTRKGRTRPLPDDLVVPRLLGVVDRWLAGVDLTSAETGEIRKRILAIEELVKR